MRSQYSILPVEVVTPASVAIMSIKDVKKWLKIESNEDDYLIAGLIDAAKDYIENYTKRTLINTTYKIGYDLHSRGQVQADGYYELPSNYGNNAPCFPREFQLPKLPLQSVTSLVTYGDDNVATTYAASNYFVDTASSRVVINDTATAPTDLRVRRQVEITYIAGYGTKASDIPKDIIQVAKYLVQYYYNNFNYFDREDGDTVEMPAVIDQLLEKYVVLRV